MFFLFGFSEKRNTFAVPIIVRTCSSYKLLKILEVEQLLTSSVLIVQIFSK